MKWIIIGAIMLITSTVLSFIWFNWQLALIVFLAITGNNIVQIANQRITELIMDHIENS